MSLNITKLLIKQSVKRVIHLKYLKAIGGYYATFSAIKSAWMYY